MASNRQIFRNEVSQEESNFLDDDSSTDEAEDSALMSSSSGGSAISRLSELQPLTLQAMAQAPIKVLTGAPLAEYTPKRKSKGFTPSSDVLIDLDDVTEQSQRSKRSKLSVSFQSPPPKEMPSLLYQADDVDSVDSESGTPMNYFPSKYRMRKSLCSLDSSAKHYEPTPSPGSILSTPSPSSQSHGTTLSNFSQLSAESRNSSVMSYRSSTSKSLLFGEVINLEGTRRPQKSGYKMYDNVITRNRQEDIERQESGNFVGMEIGGASSRRQQKHNQIRISLPLGDESEQNGRHLPQGMSAMYFLEMLKDARNLGQTTQLGIRSIGARTAAVTRQIFHYYRPPLSPRTKGLMDLEFLQRAHREKVGQLVEDDDLEDHWDFVLVLTPQEAYRFWSSLLDFRVEHLGFEALSDMEPSLKTDSTDSTQKSLSTNPSAEEDASEEKGFSTPTIGIKRRRGGSTPLSETHFRSAAKSIFTTADMNMTGCSTTSKVKQRLSMFDKAIAGQSVTPSTSRKSSLSQATPILTETRPAEPSTIRRRWGNQTQGSTSKNLLSPPIRSLTRGGSSMRIMKVNTSTSSAGKPLDAFAENDEERQNVNPNVIFSEEDIPNPVIPRGIAARTNGLLQFLSALQRGIFLRRHRSNKAAVYCKIFSNDGGDTIQYQLVDPEEAMVAFKEQRVRYNRKLTHSSSPTSVRAVAREWACFDGPGDGSDMHKFKVPDHIAAQRYREKLSREHAFSKRLLDLATKAANSGIVKASDILAVHPASHLDPRHPGVRRGELGTASLRKSKSDHFTPHSFSIVASVRQSFPTVPSNLNDGSENKWYSGEGSEIQFKTLDFEAATEGEYWLIFRGFLLLHRDATVGRFAAERRAGIGGGSRNRREQGEGHECDLENMLHRDEFTEPATAGCIEKLAAKIRKVDMTYMTGDMVAGAEPPPSDYFLGFKSAGTQIWSRLRLAGLETQRLYSVNTNRVLIKVRCPEDRLTDVAEVLRLKMKTLDGGFAPFREDTATHFMPKDDRLDAPSVYQGKMASLLGSKDRQTIIDFIIGSRIRDSGAELAQTTDVGKMIQARVPLHMHRKLDALYNVWVTYWRRENWTGKDWSGIDGDDTVHSELGDSGRNRTIDDDRFVPHCLTRLFFGAFHQPLDSIEEYFGEQVTFYFAWLEHCSWHLLFMAVLGLIVTVCQLSTNDFDHWIRPYFAIVVMIWTFMVLINWRKRNNYLAHRWGSMDVKVQETPRPEFYGEYVMDGVTQEWVVKYPAWKRYLKYLISVPISLFFTGAVLVLILNVHANRDLQMASYVEKLTNPEAEPFKFEFSLTKIGRKAEIIDIAITRDLLLDPQFWVALGALPVMLGICIPIMNVILMMVASKLNNFENYRTESEYRTHLIIKVFSFRFVSQFGTVYYYAAISTGSRQAIENGIIRMGTSLIMYTTVAYYWNIILQVYFFILIRNIRRFLYKKRLRQELKNIELEEESLNNSNVSDIEEREVRLINKRMLLDQAQDDAWFEVMRPAHNSFPEYITSVLQFSFVACFSVVLPITPLFVLFNYLIGMRFDAYKICRGRQRPLAQKTGGMGVWEDLLHIVAVIAVLTNCWLIAFTNSDFIELTKDVGTMGIFAIVVGWEHLMLLIKYVMQTVISPLPKSVRDELKREHHNQEKERYATMRLKNGVKKTESQRSLFRRGKQDRDEESISLISRECLTPERETFEDEGEPGVLYSC